MAEPYHPSRGLSRRDKAPLRGLGRLVGSPLTFGVLEGRAAAPLASFFKPQSGSFAVAPLGRGFEPPMTVVLATTVIPGIEGTSALSGPTVSKCHGVSFLCLKSSYQTRGADCNDYMASSHK